jgi:stearoyl-CoA desaturase (Delta-9 desaturase)
MTIDVDAASRTTRNRAALIWLTFLVPLAGMVGAIVHVMHRPGWLGPGLLLGGWLVTGLGITVGFHRMLAHRAFDGHAIVRGFWIAAGMLAAQGSPVVWCALHRKHHRHSDKVLDPHTPRPARSGRMAALAALWHAHIGWLMRVEWSEQELADLAADLRTDPVVRAFDRHHDAWAFASLAIPTLLGGVIAGDAAGLLVGFLWGGLARVFVTHHAAWGVNSICHRFGRIDYRTHDDSRNNGYLGVLALGEGWHNNHHAFPSSARHGLAWWQFDVSWIVIRTMQVLGLVWDVRLPSAGALKARHIAKSSAPAQTWWRRR